MTAPIIITGGAQRLGLAIAEDLLSQNHSVIITYRSKKPAIEHLIAKGAVCIQADFADTKGVNGFIERLKTDSELQLLKTGIRAIVHNASDWDQESATTDHAALFNKMMQVHASAPYQINLALRELFRHKSGSADIIHMTDFVQERGSQKHIAYAASKAALHNLTLSFSALLAPNVKVNSIAPALVMFNDHDSQEYRDKSLKKSLLEICPGPLEAVKAVNFLLDSDYITGQTIHLNGGRHLK